MPNWVGNTLTVEGTAESIARFIAAAESERGDLDFNRFIPYPERFAKLDREAREFQREIEKMPGVEREVFLKLHGYPRGGYNQGGYEWCVAHWGTKWNAGDTSVRAGETYVMYDFNTAWTPPGPVVLAMSQAFPDLSFRLEYEEPGNNFKGTFECQGGETTLDEQLSFYEEGEEENE